MNNSPLVQLVERRTVNPQVTGSSPVGGAKLKEAASLDAAFLHLKKTRSSPLHPTLSQ